MSQVFSNANKQLSLEWHFEYLWGKIMGISCRWVLNPIISIFLKRWFFYARVSLKHDKYHIYITQLSFFIPCMHPYGEGVSTKQLKFQLVFSWLISLFSKSSKMADRPNLFHMIESNINALKKPEIVKKIMELKDKVLVGEEIKSLYSYKAINRYSKSTFI